MEEDLGWCKELDWTGRRMDLAGRVAAHAPDEGDHTTLVPELKLYRRSVVSPCTSAAYEPSLVLFLQGGKADQPGQVHAGLRRFEFFAHFDRFAGSEPGDGGDS